MSDEVLETVENVENNKTVSYESHKKLLDEAKNAKLKAREFEQKLAEMQAMKEKDETDKLLEQKKYQELAVKLEKENQSLKEKMEKENARIQKIVKLKALKSKLSDVDERYISNFASFDDIQLSSDGEVDVDSLEYVAEKFKQEHSVFFVSKKDEPKPQQKVSSNSKPMLSLNEVKGLSSKEILELIKKK